MYDIRYKVGDMVRLIDDPWKCNPWKVMSIIIRGDSVITDEARRVSYNLIAHDNSAGTAAHNYELHVGAGACPKCPE